MNSGWDQLSTGYPQDWDFDDDMKSNYDKKEKREEFKEESNENKSYFNVFFSENPLKKGHNDHSPDRKNRWWKTPHLLNQINQTPLNIYINTFLFR